jgi:Ca2+-binding EF-hand superfamily protein
MEELDKSPRELFKGMDANDSGKISEDEFLNFFEDNKISKNKRGLLTLFDDCKRPGTNLLDFRMFLKRMEKVAEEEKAKNSHRDRFYITETIKGVFNKHYEDKKGSYLELFGKYDSNSTGYWNYDDYIDFMDDNKRQFKNSDGSRISQKEQKKTFDSIDLDKDGKLSESEFFKRVMPQDYNNFLLDKFGDHSRYARYVDKKLKDDKYEDVFELLNTEDMEVKTHKFRQKLYQIGLDTDSKTYTRFEKTFDGAYGRRTTKIGRLQDFINILKEDRPLNSDEEHEELRKSRKFDRHDVKLDSKRDRYARDRKSNSFYEEDERYDSGSKSSRD